MQTDGDGIDYTTPVTLTYEELIDLVAHLAGAVSLLTQFLDTHSFEMRDYRIALERGRAVLQRERGKSMQPGQVQSESAKATDA